MPEAVLPAEPNTLDEFLVSLPNVPAVFLLRAGTSEPYFARTNSLRRRLQRLLGPPGTRGSLNLRGVASSLEYYLAGSKLESRFLQLNLGRKHLGPGYRRAIRLRLPPYLKLLLSNPYPRTQIVSKLARSSRNIYMGPFRNRATASQFESALLDLFQIRRCHDDLEPSEDHPGCIYGEMGRCLRPCQAAVSVEEYRSEAARVAEFLNTGGRSQIVPAQGERTRLSEEMEFEGAARAHQKIERIEEVLTWCDEMARPVDRLHALAVTASAPGSKSVQLGWLRAGYWHGFRELEFGLGEEGRAASLDTRLREMAASIPPTGTSSAIERMEDLAVLSRWFYSSWRDGEMLVIDDWDKIPWRKLVNAVSRVAAKG